MNREESVLYRTRQGWKFWLMPTGTLICVVAVIGAIRFKDLLPGWQFQAALLIIITLQLASLAYPAIAIRCPNCGARWFWLALTKVRNGSWFNQLMQSECIKCGFRS